MKYLNKEQSDKRRIDAFLPDNHIMGKLRATYLRVSTPRVPGEPLPALAVLPTQDLLDLLKALMLTTGQDPNSDDSWFTKDILAMQPIRLKREVALKELGLGIMKTFQANTMGAGYPDSYEEGLYIFKPDSGKDSLTIYLVKKEDIEILPLPAPDKKGASVLAKLRTRIEAFLPNGKSHTFEAGTRGTFGGIEPNGLGRFKPSNDALEPIRALYGKDFETGWFEIHSTYVEVVKPDPIKKVSK